MPNGNRGAEAYRQAYAYVAASNPSVPARQLRRMAAQYLRITASPRLTWREQLAAWRARWQFMRNHGQN